MAPKKPKRILMVVDMNKATRIKVWFTLASFDSDSNLFYS
jgi:hypothetical protein